MGTGVRAIEINRYAYTSPREFCTPFENFYFLGTYYTPSSYIKEDEGEIKIIHSFYMQV
jgi:hypothetical protein